MRRRMRCRPYKEVMYVSLRGIDGQMMINRTGDYAREASVQLRRGDVAQDYLAHQNKVLADLKKEQVAQLEGKEAARIRLDERPEGDPRQGSRKKKKKQPPAPVKDDGFVPDDPTVGISLPKRLDIEV